MSKTLFLLLLLFQITSAVGHNYDYDYDYDYDSQQKQNDATVTSAKGKRKLEMSTPYPHHHHHHMASKSSKSKSSFDPTWFGTISVSGDIVTPSDPTTYVSTTFKTQEIRQMFDRRTNQWEEVNAYVFDVVFSDFTDPVEFQVNPEFTQDEAQEQAEIYGPLIGQLDSILRDRLETVSIQDGNNDWGGGSNDILIHIGRTVEYDEDNITEETLIHEACHVSLDYLYEEDRDNWVAAAEADGAYISGYAKQFPFREDIAESFVLYYAVRFNPSSLSDQDYNIVACRIPNRIKYFDALMSVDADDIVCTDESLNNDDIDDCFFKRVFQTATQNFK